MYRRKTLTGSPDPTRATRRIKPCMKMSTTPLATLTTPTKDEERGGGGGNGTGAWHIKDCGNTNLCQAGG